VEESAEIGSNEHATAERADAIDEFISLVGAACAVAAQQWGQFGL
jgi:hypothetical protein